MVSVIRDQINHVIRLDQRPKRIISLVPSQTELLYDIGLEEEVVGLTKFCIHPEKWFRSKTRVGGTKTVNHEVVAQLKPDLIIANKEENSEADIIKLQQNYNVYTSDIFNLNDAFKMMRDIGELCDKGQDVERLIGKVQSDFSSLKPLGTATVLYLIWRDPYMAAGQQTFITDMLSHCGLENIDVHNQRYDEITIETMASLSPDYIFLSSEPYPFKAKHKTEMLEQVKAKVILVDGEAFSWYGSRLALFKSYWENELQPQLLK